MPRFSILEHDWPHLHWDLLLENGDHLKAWRLASAPQLGQPILAEPIADHRLLYLEYEGPISGNRGIVKIWDQGDYTGSITGRIFMIKGRRIQATLTICEIEPGKWQADIK